MNKPINERINKHHSKPKSITNEQTLTVDKNDLSVHITQMSLVFRSKTKVAKEGSRQKGKKDTHGDREVRRLCKALSPRCCPPEPPAPLRTDVSSRELLDLRTWLSKVSTVPRLQQTRKNNQTWMKMAIGDHGPSMQSPSLDMNPYQPTEIRIKYSRLMN